MHEERFGLRLRPFISGADWFGRRLLTGGSSSSSRRSCSLWHTPISWQIVLLFGATVLCSSCEDKANLTPVASPMTWDSSGVQMVENYSPRYAGSFLVELQLEIGCHACDDDAVLFGQISDILRFDDGRIAVIDVLAAEVRVFSPSGVLESRFGGRGQGPGELSVPARLGLVAGDSLVVHDQGTFSQHVFSSRGEYGRSVRDAQFPAWGNLWDWPRAWFSDGSYVIADEIDVHQLPERMGIASAEWRLMNPEGFDLGVLAYLPAKHGVSQPSVDGYQVDGVTIYGPRQSYGVDSVSLWHAFPVSYEFRQLKVDGTLKRIVRRSWEPQLVTTSLRSSTRRHLESQYRERSLMRGDGSSTRLEAEIAAIAIADTLPAFRQIRVSRRGDVWVERYPAAAEINPVALRSLYSPSGVPEWSIFDSDGIWIGTVTLPAAFTVHEVGSDYVLGVWRDDLGVQFVRLYRVAPPPSRSG